MAGEEQHAAIRFLQFGHEAVVIIIILADEAARIGDAGGYAVQIVVEISLSFRLS